MEVAVLTKRDETRLENWQTRKLRFLARSPAHVHHDSNAAVRQRTGVPTVASTFLERRLAWWQGVLRPAFPDLQEHPQEDLAQEDLDEPPVDPKYDPTKM
eukprot:1510007-Pyramimonas_sp.AAC.1